MDDPTFLVHGEGCYPDRDQSVLAEGQAKLRMRRNLEEELSIPPRMGQLAGLWAAVRQAAEDKRPRMEGEFLFALVAPFMDELDSFELPKPTF